MDLGPIDWEREVALATARLDGRVRRTPLLASAALTERFGRAVLLKAESLQTTGSFKLRPALNGLLAARDEALKRGVVTSSSGNFGGAVAWCSREEGVAATIVLQPGTTGLKLERMQRWGAQLRFSGDDYADRQRLVDAIREATGAVELHPHSSVETVAGDATCGLELLDQAPAVRSILVPTSGGGLLGGIALAVHLRNHPARVWGVQSAGNPAFVRSYREGRAKTHGPMTGECDGLTATTPGRTGFALALQLVAGMIEVPEAAILDAVRWSIREEKLVVEPSGAVGIAALESPDAVVLEPPVAVVLTGGNVAPERLAQWLRG